jgi:Bifunctional DNA primase/polymerase, N-terminal
MSRLIVMLRDAALGYASRGIPVLPLHYPLPHRRDLQALTGDQQLPSPAARTSCSCRDPGCGQVGKHPLGSLVPHGVNDASCNRARLLAWWSSHPQANIGLATGYRFDVLDVDSPAGERAIRQLAAIHGLASSGPLVRTGGGGWHFYLAPTGLGNVDPRGLEHVDWRGRGGYVVAHPAATRAATPTSGQPAAAWTLHPARCPRCCSSGSSPANSSDQQLRSNFEPSLTAPVVAMRGRPWPKSWPGSPPPRSASATVSCGSRPATSTTWSPLAPSTPARSTKGCWMPPSVAGCWPRSRARPTGPWPRAARWAWPTPAAHASPPAPNAPSPRGSRLLGRLAREARTGGDGHGQRRPPGRLNVPRVGACRRQAEPAPTHHPRRKEPAWAAIPP